MYSTLSNIRESFKLAWKHKMLWILALIVMGGFSFSAPSRLSDLAKKNPESEKSQIKTSSIDRQIPAEVRNSPVNEKYNSEKVSDEEIEQKVKSPAAPENSVFGGMEDKILGAAGARPAVSFSAILGSLLFAVPLVFLSLLFWGVISFLIKVWGTGALYSGLIKACNSETYDFKDLGNEGKRNWKRYLKLAIYFFYKRLLSVLPFFGAVFIYTILIGSERSFSALSIIFVILAVSAGISAFIYNILLYFVEQYSLRLIISDNIPTKATFRRGWQYYKTRPGKSLKLVLALIFVIPVFTAILFLPTGLLIAIISLLIKQEVSSSTIFIVGALAILVGGITLLVSSPFISNILNFSWTRLFLFIRGSFPAGVTQPIMAAPEQGSEEINGQI